MTEENNFDETKIYDPQAFQEQLEKAQQSEKTNSRAARRQKEEKAPTNSKKTQKPTSAQGQMVQSTAWLTFGNITSRLLGAVYMIPWIIWLGSDADVANALFSKGYNIYALFLMISTAGIPAAVAKQTARYNSMNEYKLSRDLLFYTLRLMMVAGVICTLLMYFGAPILAEGNQDLIPVMRSLSVVLLIFPSMSVLRGFFQGNSNMKPYALSQIVEQIARVVYLLAATYLIMKIGSGDYRSAVVQSTFAAFIGVICAFAVLLYSLFKNRRAYRQEILESDNKISFSGRQLVWQMVLQAVPFIVIGSGTSIFKIIDQYTFENTMALFTNYSPRELTSLFALVSANPDKLSMVVIALGTALATAGLPLITEKFTQKDKAGLSHLVSNNLQLFFFVMAPATLGMIVLSYPLNTLFYWPDQLGSNLLIASCISGILMGLFIVTSTMLQGMDGNKVTMRLLGIAVLVKLITQVPLIFLFKSYGPLIATFVGLLVGNMFIIDQIHVRSQFDFKATAKGVIKTFGMALIMAVVASVVRFGLSLVLSSDSKVQSMIIILITAAVGALVYSLLALKTRTADQLLGSRVAGIRRRLGMK
ncbi:polysaccharide biosynthesis protein [Enterococcus sp. ALS3]|uniref:Polysaccharide biosynthesis protein n=1 Tax=Enterococcus alishanensis TaxID=1303817 RepID=A0ABS6TD16_9ENTE|nr:polysaccharide biosynthesis protein [Enterococcus alishanensis]